MTVSHPYDKLYLQEIVETQGALFERLQDVAPTVTVWNSFDPT